MTNPKPKFKHDCNQCEFIGNISINGKEFDAYHCSDNFLIARFGNEPEDNSSSKINEVTPINEFLFSIIPLYIKHRKITNTSFKLEGKSKEFFIKINN